MNKDKELVWKKLSEPARTWPPTPKITVSVDGTMMFKDIFADGTEVDIFDLSTPFDMSTASYRETEYLRMWG